jgi:hypothetical protein
METIIVPKPKSITLNINEGVIQRSKRQSTNYCLIATAVREQVRGAWSVNVKSDSVSFNQEGFRLKYTLCAADQLLAQAYDDTGKAEPAKVHLHWRTCFVQPVVLKGPHKTPKAKHRRRIDRERIDRCKRRYLWANWPGCFEVLSRSSIKFANS